MLVKSFEYKIWADLRTLDAISLVDPQENQKQYAFILQQLNHMVIVEDLFRAWLETNPAPHEATNSVVVPNFEQLKTRLVESGKWYLNFVTGASSNIEDESLSFQFGDGQNGLMSFQEILFHIVNHGSYHRGSIAKSLDLSGVDHPADGYGIFIHQLEPERRTEFNNHGQWTQKHTPQP